MTKRQIVSIVLAVQLVAAQSLAGLPNPVAVEGQATFQQDGANWTITTATDRTVINWDSFGVDQGAQMHFAQPNAGSSVLNQVLGAQASHINGMLTSNGSVYLFNPNGIVIGPAGIIQVADFVASTLPVSTAEFLAGGDMNFKGVSLASIENYGKIEAIGGDIYLIASNVVNKGALKALTGSANLVAGGDVLLTQDHHIFVRPSLLTDGMGIGVENSGVIDAAIARLQADGNMYALAINNIGVVRATGSVIADGRVLLQSEDGLVVNSGSLAARTVGADGSTVGGEIQVLGEDVAITGSATIDASGDMGGGRILIGGDRQGANPAVLNAATTSVGPDAVVAANALVAGDGGTVIVWSDNSTTVNGAISAVGAGGGSGGFVETSGGVLNIDGLDLALGAGGTLLIDAPPIIGPAEATAIIGALNGGGSVWYPSTSITVAADIVASPPSGAQYLFLDSDSFIAFNANIAIGSASLYLQASTGATQAPGTSLAAANLWVGGSGNFALTQPGNDFGTLSVLANGIGNVVSIQDVNDLAIGSLGGTSGILVRGGEVHITTPNGSIFANGLFPAGIVTGYHSLGNVVITETMVLSGVYEVRISNLIPDSKPPAAVESFLGLAPGSLNTIDPNTNMGSAVMIEFGNLAGDSLAYSWNFRIAETFGAFSANDYSFVVVDPGGAGAPGPELLADVETARSSAIQDNDPRWRWKTGWAQDARTLNGVDPYTMSFGVMHVNHTEQRSDLFLRDVLFTGHIPGFIFDRIFDHVEDFPHVRPDERISTVGAPILAPMLDDLSTYFDGSSQRTDHTYYYQSVGSIYQIPR